MTISASILSVRRFALGSFLAIGIAAILPSAAFADSFAGGDGTSGTPYLIANCVQLQSVTTASSTAYYQLANDIDCSDTSNWNGLQGFLPIGPDTAHAFLGHFDGNGHVISDLYIHPTSTGYAGLFGVIGVGATITNVGLDDANIVTPQNYGGALVAYSNGSVSGSYATGSASSTGTTIYVGGLIGFQDSSATVTNSYSRVTVNGYEYVGGLVARNYGNITNSYAAGATTATITADAAGLTINSGVVVHSFYDRQTTGQTTGGGTGTTTVAMKTESIYTDIGWDFDDVWSMTGPVDNDGYPVLQWQQDPTPPSFSFTGGTGTSDDPYQVDSCDALQAMSQDLTASYLQTQDIDCTDSRTWNSDGSGGYYGFDPVGNDGVAAFTGTFDGGHHTISNLYIERHDDNNGIGLFGFIDGGATIKNVSITHSHILGHEEVGGIAGRMDSGSISNSSVNLGTTEGESCVAAEDGGDDGSPTTCVWARLGVYGGGIVGVLSGGTIDHVQTAGPVKGSGNIIGGLIGQMNGGTLEYATSSSDTDGGTDIGGALGELTNGTVRYVNVSGSQDANQDEGGKQGTEAGGFVGKMDGGLIEYSSAAGTASATQNYAGGFVGVMDGGEIGESFATGDAHAANGQAGGFVADLSIGSIHDSYATGDAVVTVNGGIEAGGFAGRIYGGTIERAYASGSASASDYVGGFAGSLGEYIVEILIQDSFATAHVGAMIPDVAQAGFIGGYHTMVEGSSTDDAELVNDYFDLTGTGASSCFTDADGGDEWSGASLDGCNGVNSASSQPSYFLQNSTNAPLTAWDFDTVWAANSSALPTLRAFGDGSYTAPEQNQPSGSSHRAGGGSVQTQVQNLAAMGNTAAASALVAQWPQLFGEGTSTQAGSSTAAKSVVRDLQVGSQGEDVMNLQKLLNAAGFALAATGVGSAGNETAYFGSLTKNALAAYQKAHGIVPAAGYFGPITRAQMKTAGVTGIWW